ncbi:6-phosphogluconolactonase [Candidatus Peribacteria bacterium]|jgi:6-phosphogluconolactonase|nr:6-phosphogluconolactonase [Candidatus Peribacteria bacterium]MBT4020842.1 6-phosphogluconolactonase [Candidatus Peribacteria bacterium]MBT4241131.1 6-phosphogluconolactonase [Candidatus Peribacteria bacterium]MBT4473853.1 6-phosphogluconolactonase [Candidatus Peribacteria bacterium]
MTNFQFQKIEADSEDIFVNESIALLTNKINKCISEKGECSLGLSGGSTPRKVYEELGKQDIDWSKVIVFLVDDRYVPRDHEDSNQKLVDETLLKNAEPKIIFPDTSLEIEKCIEDYEKRLPSEADIVVLGMGGDGHIASLFPGDIDALTEENKKVLHTTTDSFAVKDRITVTMPFLKSAGTIIFLIKGEDKVKVFNKMTSANVDIIEYPAHGALSTGRTIWIAL